MRARLVAWAVLALVLSAVYLAVDAWKPPQLLRDISTSPVLRDLPTLPDGCSGAGASCSKGGA